LKLLLDHHLSHKLITKLADIFPGSTQTRLLGFTRMRDLELWFYARTHGFIFVSKDKDLVDIAILRGAPPKVVWLKMGNCTVSVVEKALRRNQQAIEELAADPNRIILEVFE